MMDSFKDKNLYFEIHPLLIFQLGKELISDSAQALLELIKNSYDADASRVRVTINTKEKINPLDFPHSRFKDEIGYILIQDDGIGMNYEIIKKSWLTISYSVKRDMKKEKRVTEKFKRTPIGDKGLGRFSTQRLGNNLEIFSKNKKDEDGIYVGFSWKDFEKSDNLLSMPIFYEKCNIKSNGTKLLITGLNPNEWEDITKNYRYTINYYLQKELSMLISPFEEIRNFNIEIFLNEKKLDLADVSKKVREGAKIQYKLDFDGKVLCVKSKARINYFKAKIRDTEGIYRQKDLINYDSKDDFYEFLLTRKQATLFNVKRASQEDWFIEYELVKNIEDNITELKKIGQNIANPGNFKGEIDFFEYIDDYANIFNKDTEYKKIIEDHVGIRIYRDGFGIRVDQDWLELGELMSRGSYYGLRPKNVIGYILLSAKDNLELKETTDREGFIKNQYYENFIGILQEFVHFSEKSQKFIRSSWKLYLEKQKEKAVNISDKITTLNLSKQIHLGIKEIEKKSRKYLTKIQEAKDKDLSESIFKLTTCLDELTQKKKELSVLSDRIEQDSLQIKDFWNFASLGIAVELLTHEINEITKRLSDGIQVIQEYCSNKNIENLTFRGFIEDIKDNIFSLKKEIGRIDPSLRYMKGKKEKIDLNEFFKEIRNYYNSKYDIEIRVTHRSGQNFMLHINKGTITQIIDNLINNSIYWLKQEKDIKGIISIEIAKPFVRISDNGKGIDPLIESLLFEPFMTMKKNGRGLGLFIVSQLLDAENCSVRLLSDRNKNNRLYIFEINFTGGLYDRD